ncbi:MAG: YheC/YheD family protein [Syntrophomonadaceae bacterium]|nr:YheC/YheD family protein [Syntrophomonadaceae bacterium]
MRNMPEIVLHHQFDMSIPEHINIHIGKQTIKVKVIISSKLNTGANYCFIPPSTAHKLSIPSGNYLVYKYDLLNLYIGPIIAVLTAGNNKRPYPVGRQARLYKELSSQAGKQGVFLYFFNPEGYRINHSAIRGYRYDEKGNRHTDYFPFPNIVYNRVLYRSIERQPFIQSILNSFIKDPQVFLFNTRFLNKWEVNRELSQGVGKVYLPDTKRYNPDNLRTFLETYPEVFLKPINNSKGQGIIKIVNLGNGTYTLARAEWKNIMPLKFNSLEAVNKYLRQNKISLRHYIVQQGIQLATYNGRVFDLRTQYQKNRQGNWILTGVGARVAGNNRFVTHIPNGGYLANYSDIIKQVFPSSDAQLSIDRELHKIGQTIPPLLEHQLGINLGILSFDIGIDKQGRIRILEINSKPASFDEDDIRGNHLKHLVDYFIYAAS